MSWRARVSVALNELRVIYCPTSSASQGTREFLAKYYPDLKTLNPGLPIYVRPSDGTSAALTARYEQGVYQSKPTNNMSADDVMNAVKELCDAAAKVNGSTSPIGSAARIPEVI